MSGCTVWFEWFANLTSISLLSSINAISNQKTLLKQCAWADLFSLAGGKNTKINITNGCYAKLAPVFERGDSFCSSWGRQTLNIFRFGRGKSSPSLDLVFYVGPGNCLSCFFVLRFMSRKQCFYVMPDTPVSPKGPCIHFEPIRPIG